MAALAGNKAAHNRTAEAVAGISATVTGTVDDLIGRRIGTLKSDVLSLGQDVHALRTLLATMHEKPPPPAAPPDGAPVTDGTTPPHKVNFVHADANATPPSPPTVKDVPTPKDTVVDDNPPPAANGSTTATSKLFPNGDTANLRVIATRSKRFHSVDQRLPTGGRHDDNAPTHEGDRWANHNDDRWAPGWQQSWQQRALPPNRTQLTNPYRPSCPRVQDTHPQVPQLFGNNKDALLGGSISSPRNVDRRRQAANAKVSPFDIAALANIKYHGGSEGYYTLTPSIIHQHRRCYQQLQ